MGRSLIQATVLTDFLLQNYEETCNKYKTYDAKGEVITSMFKKYANSDRYNILFFQLLPLCGKMFWNILLFT